MLIELLKIFFLYLRFNFLLLEKSLLLIHKITKVINIRKIIKVGGTFWILSTTIYVMFKFKLTNIWKRLIPLILKILWLQLYFILITKSTSTTLKQLFGWFFHLKRLVCFLILRFSYCCKSSLNYLFSKTASSFLSLRRLLLSKLFSQLNNLFLF